MHHLLASLCVCALLLTLPARAAEEPLAKGQDDHVAQVIGWSANEKRFALRLYVRAPIPTARADQPPPPCEGYTDLDGNPFHGGVFVAVYEGTRQLALFPIQDRQRCTPLADAQARLDAAMKRLGTLGIRLDLGKELLPEGGAPSLTVKEGPQAPYTLEYVERGPTQTPNPKASMQRGTLEQELYVRKGDARQKVLTRKSPYAYSTAAAGYWRSGLDRVVLSPSGKTLVVFSYERVGNMSGGRKSLRLLGMLSWSGDTLKPL